MSCSTTSGERRWCEKGPKQQTARWISGGTRSSARGVRVEIPKYHEWQLPLLKLLDDGQARRVRDVYDILAERAGLDAVARAEMLPSGAQAVYRNRIGWARTYLKKAGMVYSPARGMVAITPAGRDALAEAAHSGIRSVDAAWLERHSEKFAAWRQRSAENAKRNHGQAMDGAGSSPPPIPADAESPLETLERVYTELHADLADEVLERVKQVTPAYFEQIVLDVVRAMGYGGSRDDAGKTTKLSGDGGVDGVIDQDRLGLDKVYLQAKRWEGTVGRPVVQAFSGALEGERASKGVLITTSTFSADARQYIRTITKHIVLIDGHQLADLMIECNVGVSPAMTYVVKRIDGDYFDPD